MDLITLHHRTVEEFLARVAAVAGDQWERSTPCSEWTVRELVNHVVGEDRWTSPLLAGSTIADVGDRLDGDLLGDDPARSARAAADEATAAVAERLPEGGHVHLSYGDEDMEEYVWQLVADHLIHAGDLAAAIDGDRKLDPELVAEVAEWFADREALYRAGGVIAARGPLSDGHSNDGQSALLSAFGRDPSWGPVHAALASFSAAFGRGDVEAIMALMTDDCHFESTSPPDGAVFDGAEAVAGVWRDLFGGTRVARFSEEESFVVGDRGVLRWVFNWTEDDGSTGHVRGVDIMRFRGGKVAEKLSYVKG